MEQYLFVSNGTDDPYSGVLVTMSLFHEPVPDFAVGDEVRIVGGIHFEERCTTLLRTFTDVERTGLVRLVPAAVSLQADDEDQFEYYEGMLVSIDALTVTGAKSPHGSYLTAEGIFIDDMLFGASMSVPAAGTVMTRVTGMLVYFESMYGIRRARRPTSSGTERLAAHGLIGPRNRAISVCRMCASDQRYMRPAGASTELRALIRPTN